jgi:hypothetical protein
MAASEHFPLLEAKDVFEALLGFNEDEEAFSIAALSSSLSERSKRILAEISFGDSVLVEESAAGQALHCLKALEAKALHVQMDTLRRQVKQMESSGNLDGAMRLLNELNGLAKGQSGS